MSATLLIMGSMIGTGMVGMPSAQGGSGLLPSFAMLIFGWFYTLCCSRLLLEACSWLPRGSNFMSIVSHFLGKRFAVFCWCFYAIYFYCAVTTHIAGAGTVVGGFFRHGLADVIGSIVFTAFFAGFVYNSLQASDRLNRLLMLGLTLTCFLFIPVISPHINFSYLKETHWSRILPAMQVFLYAFSFQYIIPSLYNYLECDTRAMKKAIWIGSLSTLVLYMAWIFLVLGVVPPSELQEALATGQGSIVPIEKHLKIPLLSGLVREFIILAISTSFLAVTITFFDFWADTLKWGKRGFHGAILLILVFVLPLILALNSSALFVSILDAGGIFGGTLVFGVFPVLFVWIGRYRKYSRVAPELLPGGKAVLILTLLVSIATLLVAVVF